MDSKKTIIPRHCLSQIHFSSLSDLIAADDKALSRLVASSAVPLRDLKYHEIESKFLELLAALGNSGAQFFEEEFIPTFRDRVRARRSKACAFLRELEKYDGTALGIFVMHVGHAGQPDIEVLRCSASVENGQSPVV
jgi:hypothetical protein